MFFVESFLAIVICGNAPKLLYEKFFNSSIYGISSSLGVTLY